MELTGNTMLCEAVLVTLILCNRSRTVCTLCLHWPFSGAGRKGEVFATSGQVHETIANLIFAIFLQDV